MKVKIKLEKYQTDDGRIPLDEWIEKLKDSNGKAAIWARLDRIQYQGNFGDTDPVGEGVSELKIHVGPGYRVYYGKRREKAVLLLAGGDKSTQKKDIKKAQEYWSDYKKTD